MRGRQRAGNDKRRQSQSAKDSVARVFVAGIQSIAGATQVVDVMAALRVSPQGAARAGGRNRVAQRAAAPMASRLPSRRRVS